MAGLARALLGIGTVLAAIGLLIAAVLLYVAAKIAAAAIVFLLFAGVAIWAIVRAIRAAK